MKRVYSNAPWESQVGYCRSLRVDHHIWVTGTAPVDAQGNTVSPGDGYAQAKRCLEIIELALKELGASIESVVRTRMYVTDISRWEEFGRAHREVFERHPPTTTMVEVSRLIDAKMMIEIEAEAFIQD